MSKRFPTRELEKTEALQPPMLPQGTPAPRRKTKPATNGVDKVPAREETPRHTSPKAAPQSTTIANTSEKFENNKTAVLPEPEPKLSGSESEDYGLGSAPARLKKDSTSLEELFGLLYSEGYLDTLTNDPRLLAQFTSFLTKYKPSLSPLVLQYLETQKVTKAINYANAVALSLPSENASPAAELSASFKASSESIFQNLLNNALPAWVTYSLTKTASFCLTSEITNTSTSLTQDLVKGLSEVFCLTDPTKPDNPIIYASPEFYSLTGYPKEKVIGYNCRFLQGSKTDRESVQRLKSAIENGEEICEALMNYTRERKPFVNLLLLAPLRDGKVKVRYYLGAQVDCSVLVEGRRGVDGFERLLLKREMLAREEKRDGKGKALERLRDLSAAFDLEECAVVRSGSRRGSTSGVKDTEQTSGKQRRRIVDEDGTGSEEDDPASEVEKGTEKWKLAGDDKSGRLPGLYKKYILVRPYPSLRMIFVSQAAQRLGKLQQRHFMAHIAAPSATLAGLKDSFQSGTPVTVKIALMDHAGDSKEGTVTGRWGKRGKDPSAKGNVCWISATPLLDTDDNTGVWMVVIVDEKSAASNRNQVPSALWKRDDEHLDIRIQKRSERAPENQGLGEEKDRPERGGR